MDAGVRLRLRLPSPAAPAALVVKLVDALAGHSCPAAPARLIRNGYGSLTYGYTCLPTRTSLPTYLPTYSFSPYLPPYVPPYLSTLPTSLHPTNRPNYLNLRTSYLPTYLLHT